MRGVQLRGPLVFVPFVFFLEFPVTLLRHTSLEGELMNLSLIPLPLHFQEISTPICMFKEKKFLATPSNFAQNSDVLRKATHNPMIWRVFNHPQVDAKKLSINSNQQYRPTYTVFSLRFSPYSFTHVRNISVPKGVQPLPFLPQYSE